MKKNRKLTRIAVMFVIFLFLLFIGIKLPDLMKKKESTIQEPAYAGQKTDYDMNNIKKFSEVNYSIRKSIMDIAYLSPPDSTRDMDYLNLNIEQMMPSLNSLIDEMEMMSVPEDYNEEHIALMDSYKQFQQKLVAFQKGIKHDGLPKSKIDTIHKAYSQLIGASDNWYAVYKERTSTSKNDGQQYAIGTLQEHRLYLEGENIRINFTLKDIESSIYPYIERNDLDSIYKLSSAIRNRLPRLILHMEKFPVPKSFNATHQRLIDLYKEYNSLLTDYTFEQMYNDKEYLGKLQTTFNAIKKVTNDWNHIHQEQVD